MKKGLVTLTHRDAPIPTITLSISELLDRQFSRRAVPAIRRLLKHSRANLTVQLESLQAPHFEQIEQLLARLQKYGDRISVVVDENLELVKRIAWRLQANAEGYLSGFDPGTSLCRGLANGVNEN